MSIEQVEEAITILYNPATSPEQKTFAQQWLQTIQRDPSSWAIASQLLRSQSPNSRFFGALTFNIKISRDWNSLSKEQLPQLRDELLSCLLQTRDNPPFVITKLCVALASYAIHDESGLWSNFITSFCHTIDAYVQQAENDDVSVSLQVILLEFFAVVPEEVGKAEMTASRKAKITQELNESTALVLSRVQRLLNLKTTGSISNINAFRHMKQKAIRCIQSWVQYGIPIGSLGPLITKILEMLQEPDMFDAAIEALIELIGHPSIHAYAATFSDSLLAVVTSGVLRNEFIRAIEEPDEHIARIVCRLLVEYGETFYPYVVRNLKKHDVQIFLDMMLACTGFGGYFAAEQELSELPLTFWALLQEELEDARVLPGGSTEDLDIYTDPTTGRPIFRAGAVTVTDEARVDLINIAPATSIQRTDAAEITHVAKNVFSRLVAVLRLKVAFPPETEWAQWAKDIRDRFATFRRDCGDAIISGYAVLQDDMLAYLVPLAVNQLNEVVLGSTKWQQLEATLFCIKAISDSIPYAEDRHVPRLFGDELLVRLCALQPEELPRVKLTMSRLIGAYAEWFKLHPTFIGPALNFLIVSMQFPRTAPAAVDGLLELCDVCRTELVDAVDMLVNIWVQMGPSLQSVEKSRLVKAVTIVIERLPYPALLPRLLPILGGIINDIRLALDATQRDLEEVKESVISQLGYLKACCQGIQPPEIDVDSSTDSLTGPAPSASGSNDTQLLSVAAVIWEVTQQICTIFVTDEEVMQALCAFINETLRSTLPIFTPNLHALTSLLVQLYITYPRACFLGSAASIAGAYGDGLFDKAPQEQQEQLKHMLREMSTFTVHSLQTEEQMEHYPDIVQSYFELLTRCAIKCPWALSSLPADVLRGIFHGLVLKGLQVQERLAWNAILEFLITFISLDYETSELAPLIRQTMEHVGQDLVREIIEGIGGRLPRSMDDRVAEVLFKLIVKFPEASRAWLMACLSQEGFPSLRLTSQDKEIFLQAVVGSRLAKRTKDAVKQFSLKCRGLANTTYAT